MGPLRLSRQRQIGNAIYVADGSTTDSTNSPAKGPLIPEKRKKRCESGSGGWNVCCRGWSGRCLSGAVRTACSQYETLGVRLSTPKFGRSRCLETGTESYDAAGRAVARYPAGHRTGNGGSRTRLPPARPRVRDSPCESGSGTPINAGPESPDLGLSFWGFISPQHLRISGDNLRWLVEL